MTAGAPLRFCHLTTFYPPFNFGGDGIAVQRLCRALARRGHHVTVVHDLDAYGSLHRGAAPDPEPDPEPDPGGIDVVGMRSGLGALSPALTQQAGRPVLNGRRIRRLLDEGAFDVVNFHNVSLLGGPGLLRLGRGLKLYTAHEHWLVCPSHVLWRHDREPCTGRECLRCVLAFRRPPQAWRYTFALERALDHVDSFIAMSEFSRAKHREFGFTRHMEVLPSFLPDGPAPAGPATGAPPHDRPYFLFVGRLERIKGLDGVIPLFRHDRGADLLVAGEGDHGPHLRQLAAGIGGVRFLGRVAGPELDRLYRHAVALIVPSVGFETFGITLIEAFRAGTPVIARRIGPFPEIVETAGSGLLFSDADGLLGAMERLRRQPGLRDEHIRRGRRAFDDHWSESAVLPRYLDIVRRAAGRRGDRRLVAALAV